MHARWIWQRLFEAGSSHQSQGALNKLEASRIHDLRQVCRTSESNYKSSSRVRLCVLITITIWRWKLMQPLSDVSNFSKIIQIRIIFFHLFISNRWLFNYNFCLSCRFTTVTTELLTLILFIVWSSSTTRQSILIIYRM